MILQVVAAAPPKRLENAYGKAVVVASLLLLGANPFVPAPPERLASVATHGALLAALLVTLGVSVALGQWDAIHIALVAVLYLGAYCLPVIGGLWPLPLAVVLAAYGAVVACAPQARRSARFWQRGTIDRTTVVWMVLFIGAAAIALVTWRFAANVDMARYRHFVPPNVPRWLILAGVVPFAMF